MSVKEPIIIRKLKNNDDIQVVQYDLSDEKNFIDVQGIKYGIGHKSNLGLAVIDNNTESVFQPVVNERVFVVQLLVSRTLFNFSAENTSLANSESYKVKNGKNILFFNDHIDSESRVIMHAFKIKSFLDAAFEMYVRGVALRLLSNFIDQYSNTESLFFMSEKDAAGLIAAEKFLFENLSLKFPGLHSLADIAGMSASKYMMLFKKKYSCTPNDFYWRKKLDLAKIVLQSGKFESVTGILTELNITKINYFSSKYKLQFGKTPLEDFISVAL